MPTYNPYTDTHAIEKYQFLHHFLPHPDTKKRAKFLSHQALALYLFVLVAAAGFLKLLPVVAPGVLGYSSNITIVDLLNETNGMREEHGLERLRLNPELTNAATEKARHMFAHDYWAHIAPDGTEPWDFILTQEYDYSYAGENLAKSFNTSDEVVEAWFRSPTHKDNLLNPHYTEIGFAVVNGVLDGYETTLVVQMFGRPRDLTQVATVLEEEALLEQLAPEVPVGAAPATQIAGVPVSEEILPAVDVTQATRTITLVVGGFLFVLLALDIWYTKRKAIPKVTGHAYMHILILSMTLVGVWFALTPGRVL